MDPVHAANISGFLAQRRLASAAAASRCRVREAPPGGIDREGEYWTIGSQLAGTRASRPA
jgi:hypothetical protein